MWISADFRDGEPQVKRSALQRQKGSLSIGRIRLRKASLILFAVLVFSAPAFSGDLGEKGTSSLVTLERAKTYSFDTGGIAVLIRYGTGNSVSPDEIGRSFVKEIHRRGEKARYFYYEADWVGVSVEYHIRYSALGPWDANSAAANISKAVARAKAARNVHGW